MIRPKIAMVLAAGRGERLRPITDSLPKPLVRLSGRTLLDHALDRLEEAGVETVVVNVHYLADRIIAHLAERPSPRIIISREGDAALETGGGIVHALPLLGAEPFFVVNGDSFWLNGKVSALERLSNAWDPALHDGVILLQRSVSAIGHDIETGDFTADQLGRPKRRQSAGVAPSIYSGIQLVSAALFQGAPEGAFSINRLWDRAIEAGRLGSIIHDGLWFHVSTPAGLEMVQARLEELRAER